MKQHNNCDYVLSVRITDETYKKLVYLATHTYTSGSVSRLVKHILTMYLSEVPFGLSATSPKEINLHDYD